MNPQLKQWACPWRYGMGRIRDVRLHDISPAKDVLRSEFVAAANREDFTRRRFPLRNLRQSSVLKAHSRLLSNSKESAFAYASIVPEGRFFSMADFWGAYQFLPSLKRVGFFGGVL
jgi:hypothetical protein